MATRESIIEVCLENKIRSSGINSLLIKNGLQPLSQSEAECYDIIINNNYKITNQRHKILIECLFSGLSQENANLKLADNSLKPLTPEEEILYANTLERIKTTGIFNKQQENKENSNAETKKTIDTAAVQKIITDGIKNDLTFEQLNKKLKENNVNEISSGLESYYRKLMHERNFKKQGLIREGIENNLSVFELNNLLRKNELPPISMMDEMSYQKDRDSYQKNKRLDIIYECIENKLTEAATNTMLRNKGFAILSQGELEKLMSKEDISSAKNTVVSERFKKLYKASVIKYHPDKYTDEYEKMKATARIKEINIAKEKKDFFMLQKLIERYESEDM